MKLNIGCGNVYKKGYVNVDVQEGTIADRIMSAYHLELDDSTVERIECHHVLEHLNPAEATFALSEFYRVLRTGGVLTIRTPDIKASFKRFLKASEEERKYLMNWIYGIDVQALGHKYGYPDDLLKTLLRDTGFSDIATRNLHSKSVQPELHASCKKREGRLVHEFLAQLLKKLVERGTAEPSNQVKALEVYSVIKAVQPDLEGILSGNQNKGLSRITAKLAAHSPSISVAFVKTAVDMRVAKESETTMLQSRLENLMTIGMPRILVQMIKQHPILGTDQHIAFDSVLRLGMRSISKTFSEADGTATIQALEQSEAKVDVPQGVDLFTEGMLRIMSEDSNGQASKEFALGNLEEASKLYTEALMLDRGNLVARRNLSRVLYLLGILADSFRHLEETKLLSAVFPRAYQKQVTAVLAKEKRMMMSGQNELLSTPVYSIFTT